jgi:hypothetical protein
MNICLFKNATFKLPWKYTDKIQADLIFLINTCGLSSYFIPKDCTLHSYKKLVASLFQKAVLPPVMTKPCY